MGTVTINGKINTVDTFRVRGEVFVVMKKDYLDELLILMKSFSIGEGLLKEGKTRSFRDFLRLTHRRKK